MNNMWTASKRKHGNDLFDPLHERFVDDSVDSSSAAAYPLPVERKAGWFRALGPSAISMRKRSRNASTLNVDFMTSTMAQYDRLMTQTSGSRCACKPIFFHGGGGLALDRRLGKEF